MADTNVVVPLVVITIFWILVGAGGPWIVPHSQNRGVIQTMLVMIAVCCYTFWLLCFLHQLNPLVGPQIDSYTLSFLREHWPTVEVPAKP